MKKRELYFLLFLFIPLFSFAQINSETKRANHWYFGLGAGLDFSSGVPIADTSGKTNTYEGVASISDIYGGLLFYSDGNTIWNRNHQVMQGGYNLMGCDPNLVPINVSQNALIIPNPSNDSLYYLFHLGCTDYTLYTLQYTIVNMKLNGGFGGVISANNPLIPTRAQGLGVCRHSDGCSVWVVAMDTLNYYNFFKVDALGINNPVLQFSQINTQLTQSGASANYKFSSDLKLMVSNLNIGFGNDTMTIFQFDNSNAQLSSSIQIYTGNQEVYDMCFSPDNTKLYVTQAILDNLSKAGVYQYDIADYQYDSIINSKTQLYYDSVSFGHIQNGPDGKIYIARIAPAFAIPADYLATINNPNTKGLGCGFNLNGASLQGKICVYSLPNFDQAYFYPLLSNPCINGIEYLNNETIQIFPTVFNSDFTIKNSAADNFTIKIRDVTGKVYYDSELNPYQTKIISMKNTSDGMYFLSLNNGQQVINYKLIKMNI